MGTYSLIILAFLLLAVIAVIIIASYYHVKLVNLKAGIIEFFRPKEEKSILFCPVLTVDPVISRNGKVYKLHLTVSILIRKEIDITNWLLKIKSLNPMVFKQYFIQDNNGDRHPLGKLVRLPIKVNRSFVIGLEFEPEKEYNKIIFKNKAYKARLICNTPEGTNRYKFKFRVRERNLENIRLVAEEVQRDNKPKVISFPMI